LRERFSSSAIHPSCRTAPTFRCRSPLRAGIGDNGAVTESDQDAPAVSPYAAPAVADPVLAAAVDAARAAAVEVGGDTVGEHLSAVAEPAAVDEHVVTHAFAAHMPGYTGWYWAVTVVRAASADTATVDEVVLLPGADALLAPAWVPWQERLRPGDLSPGDLVPPAPNDPRLVPAYSDSGDPAEDEVAFELGLGRARVLSREGRLDAAERWFEGDHGPSAAMARHAPAHCGTCGFLLPLAGSLRAGFGVCGNEITATDGTVVSVEYGCGAHSEVVIDLPQLADASVTVYDDGEDIELNQVAEATAVEDEEPAAEPFADDVEPAAEPFADDVEPAAEDDA
jgi:hypothetical protein